MKGSRAARGWWGLREGCWCHKTCRSLDRRQDLETRVGLAASASQRGFGQSWGLPQSPPAFTLTNSPRASAVLSLLTLSILPAATVQARANDGHVATLRIRADILPGYSLTLAQPRAAWGGRGEVEIRDFSEAPHAGNGSWAPAPTDPFPVVRWGLMACAEEGGGSRRPKRGGVGYVGCETSRTSKEEFGFWNLEFSLSHSSFLWLEGEIEIYAIPFVFIFVLKYQILNRSDRCDIVSFSKMWFNFIKSRVRRQSWIIGSVSMQAPCLWLQNAGRVTLLFLKKGFLNLRSVFFMRGILSSFSLPIQPL